MPFSENKIRPLAVAIVRNGERLLAVRGYDKCKNEYFYRLIGGGVEFGETAEESLRREFMEELSVELVNVRQVAVRENIFVYENHPGHEITFIFEADLADNKLYEQEKILFSETMPAAQYAEWINCNEKNIYPSVGEYLHKTS